MEEKIRNREVGAVVVFVDPNGLPHNALVLAWWSETCCNVVIVSSDPEKQDSYGRQLERETSLMHKDSMGAAHGQYWMWPDEEPNPYKPPLAV